MYRVWSQLKDIPNKWIDVMEIGKLTNLTCRQVSALVNMMPEEAVQKRRDPVVKSMQLCLSLSEKEVAEMDLMMKEVCFQIKPEHKALVNEALDQEWMALPDICAKTGLEKKSVIQAISVIPDIETQYKGKITVYRKR